MVAKETSKSRSSAVFKPPKAGLWDSTSWESSCMGMKGREEGRKGGKGGREGREEGREGGKGGREGREGREGGKQEESEWIHWYWNWPNIC